MNKKIYENDTQFNEKILLEIKTQKKNVCGGE